MSAGMEIIEDSFVGIKDGVIVAVGQNKDKRKHRLSCQRNDRCFRLYRHARIGQYAHASADGLFPGNGR